MVRPVWAILGAFILGVVLTIAAGASAPGFKPKLLPVAGDAYVNPEWVVAIDADGQQSLVCLSNGSVISVNADPTTTMEQLGLQ